MTLAHFYPNDVTYQITGIHPTIRKLMRCKNTSNPEKGLTDIGDAVVREMLRIGMVVDLTHSTPLTRKKVFEINRSLGDNGRPLVFSHAGVQKLFKDQSSSDKLYNLAENEIMEIHHCHGVIGLIADNYWVFGEEEKLFQFNPVIPKFEGTDRAVDLRAHGRAAGAHASHGPRRGPAIQDAGCHRVGSHR